MSATIAEGVILAGKFRIDRELARGGMGVVVLAHHLQLDERVAIKFLLPEALENPDAVARFEREARAAAKIKSEHTVRVSDVGRFDSGAPYIVMEYLDGTDLGALLLERQTLELQEAIDYVLQACECIAEAHALGIVHRDLKPSNLFLTRRADGSACIKVLDFGISKLERRGTGGTGQSMTITDAVFGSPIYMSPEQLNSARDVDMRADVWALGVILFELLAGRPPFEGASLPQLCMAVVSQPTPSLRALRPELPEGVERVISACLEKERDLRVRSVAHLARGLSEFAPESSRLSVERIVRVSAAAGLAATLSPVSIRPPAETTAPVVETLRTGVPRSRPLLLGGTALPIVAGALTATLFLGVETPPDQPPEPAVASPVSAAALDPFPVGPAPPRPAPSIPALPASQAPEAPTPIASQKPVPSASAKARKRPPAQGSAGDPRHSAEGSSVSAFGGRL